MLTDGYYFSPRYLGDESFFVNEENVKTCWNAVQETKNAVDVYLKNNKKTGFNLEYNSIHIF